MKRCVLQSNFSHILTRDGTQQKAMIEGFGSDLTGELTVSLWQVTFGSQILISLWALCIEPAQSDPDFWELLYSDNLQAPQPAISFAFWLPNPRWASWARGVSSMSLRRPHAKAAACRASAVNFSCLQTFACGTESCHLSSQRRSSV